METWGVKVYSIEQQYSIYGSQSLDVGNQEGLQLLPSVCEILSRQAMSLD